MTQGRTQSRPGPYQLRRDPATDRGNPSWATAPPPSRCCARPGCCDPGGRDRAAAVRRRGGPGRRGTAPTTVAAHRPPPPPLRPPWRADRGQCPGRRRGHRAAGVLADRGPRRWRGPGGGVDRPSPTATCCGTRCGWRWSSPRCARSSALVRPGSRADRPAGPAGVGRAARRAVGDPGLRGQLRLGVASTEVAGFRGAVLVMTLSVYPLVYLPVAASLRNADPAQEEVARSLGAGRLRPSGGSPSARPVRPSWAAACWWCWCCSPSTAPSRSWATRPSPPRSSPSSPRLRHTLGLRALAGARRPRPGVSRRVARPRPRPGQPGRAARAAGHPPPPSGTWAVPAARLAWAPWSPGARRPGRVRDLLVGHRPSQPSTACRCSPPPAHVRLQRRRGRARHHHGAPGRHPGAPPRRQARAASWSAAPTLCWPCPAWSSRWP